MKANPILLFLFIICNLAWAPAAHCKHVLVFGDSLSAAYGLDWEQGWVQLLESQWAGNELYSEHKISNASVSGETSSGGLARLPLTLSQMKPDIVFIELGANDGLRGYPLASIKQNLKAMAELAKNSGAQVIIAGTSLPPSYGPRYVDKFRQLFRDVAQEQQLFYIDLYKAEYVTKSGYIQDDGLHPTALTQPLIRDEINHYLSKQQLID